MLCMEWTDVYVFILCYLSYMSGSPQINHQVSRQRKGGMDTSVGLREGDSASGSNNGTEEGCVKVVETGKGSHSADGRDSWTGERSADRSDCVAGYNGGGDNPAVRLSDKEEEMGDSKDVTLLGSVNSDTEHPFLVGLQDYLVSQQITRVVAHYLSFAGPKIDPRNLYNVVQLNAYLQNIETDGSKLTTMHARLCQISRITQGLTYLKFSLDPTETVKATKYLELIANWSAALGKQARETMLEDMPTAPMTDIDAFASSATMKGMLDNAVD